MCFYTWACTRALSWTQGTMFKPNMFRSNQRIWTHFSPLMGSVTMPEPNTILRIFFKTSKWSLIILYWFDMFYFKYNSTQNITMVKYILAPFIHRKTRLMGYKYIINPSNSRLIISSFLTFLTHIFLKFIFLKYHCIFFLYKVTDLSIQESTYSSKKTFCMYQLPVTLIYQASLVTNY
jgi:hypothetical protein